MLLLNICHNQLNKKKSVTLALVVIIIVAAISFSPTLKNGFTNWDDEIYLTKNPDIRDLSWKNIVKVFTSAHEKFFAPLVILSFAIEYHYFGLSPGVYHTTNLLLHLINCLLVFWLIYLLYQKISIAFITTLFFGIHPLKVESVAWVVERKDLLFSLFYLGALIAYFFYRKKANKKKLYFLAFFLFIFAMLSKPMAVSFIIVIVLIDLFTFKKTIKEILLNKIPYLLVSLFFLIIEIVSRVIFSQGSLYLNYSEISLLQKLLRVLFIPVFYMAKLIVPDNLCAVYTIQKDHLLPVSVWQILLFIASLFFIFFSFMKNRKETIFCLLFFLITISPIAPHVFSAYPYGDRFVYIPSIGIFLLIGIVISQFLNKKKKIPTIFKIIVIFLISGIIILFSHITRQRSKVWRDSITLWNDVIKKNPTYVRAYLNRGDAFKQKGELKKALKDFNTVIMVDPGNIHAYIDRGLLLIDKGELEKALEDFIRTLNLDPKNFHAYNNIGLIYFKRNDYNRALINYNNAIKLNTKYANAYYNRGVLFGAMGFLERALKDFNITISIDPYFTMAYFYRGITFEKLGNLDYAIRDYFKALMFNPNLTSARQRMVNILKKGDQ